MTTRHDPPTRQVYVSPPMSEEEWRERMLNTARSTRSGVQFLAWLAGFLVVLSLILGIIVGVQLAKIATNGTGVGSTSSVCQSQGGTLPGC